MHAALQRWLAACPLMALAAAGSAGIVLADFDVAGVRRWAFVAALVMLVSVLVFPRRWLLLVTCVLGFAALEFKRE